MATPTNSAPAALPAATPKRMPTGVKVLIWGVVVSALGYAAYYFIKQAQLLKTTTFTVKSNTVSPKSLNEVDITLVATIGNKSNFTFQVYKQNYDILIGGVVVGNVTSSDQIDLPANSSADTTLNITINPLQAIQAAGDATNAAGDLTNVTIEIKGSLSVSTGLLLISSFPIDINLNVGSLIG